MAATLLAQATLPIAGRARWDPAEADPPLSEGAVIDGRYRVIRLLGEGGMGRVYEAEHLFIRRRLALKLVRRDAGTGEGATRVIQEALVAGKVPHPTVVPVYDCAALPDGQVYVAMELLRGESLEQALRRPLPAAELLRWLAEVARGLAAAHRAGIVHRDVKPANLFLAVDAEGRVQPRILDFGIAKLLPGLAGEAAAVQTQAGALLGTPYYMAPERARGEAGGPPSDLYSLGVILYEAITGGLPFAGDNFMEVVGRHLREPPLDPRQAAPDRPIPDALAELTLALLRKGPAERPGDADAVARALAELAGQEIAGLVAGLHGAADGAAGAEAATQALVAAETRQLADAVLSDMSTRRLDAPGPGDSSVRAATAGGGPAPADAGRAEVRHGLGDRSAGAGAPGLGHVPGDSPAGAGRSGGGHVPGDSVTRGHAPGDSRPRGHAPGDSRPRGHVLEGSTTAGLRRTAALALAFAAAAGLGGWTAWRWTEEDSGRAAPAARPAAAVAEDPDRPAQPSATTGAAPPAEGPGAVAPTREPADAKPDAAGPAREEPGAAGRGSAPEEPGAAGPAEPGAPPAVAPAGKKRPPGKKTGGKAGTTEAGKGDRPKLKTDVYDD